MELTQIAIYAALAAVAAAITLCVLLVTKVPTFVTLLVGFICGGGLVLYGRLSIGYWEPFAAIVFVSNALYAIAVSFVVLWIGRSLRLPLFIGHKPSAESQNQ